jgi:hypothetical protein
MTFAFTLLKIWPDVYAMESETDLIGTYAIGRAT